MIASEGVRTFGDVPARRWPLAGYRLLAGGPEHLRLSLRAGLIVVGGGAALLALRGGASATGAAALPSVTLVSAAAAMLTALLTAALVTRWLGRRMGVVSGLIYWSSLGVLGMAPGGAPDLLVSAAVTSAVWAFGVGNAAGRRPLVDRLKTRCAFYGAMGLALMINGAPGVIMILGIALLYLLTSGDSRVVRFLIDPRGIAIVLLFTAARILHVLISPDAPPEPLCTCLDEAGRWQFAPGALAGVGYAALPWTPLVLIAVALGLRQGHYATAFWRLVGCWIIAPLALASLGLLGAHPRLGVVLPALAAIAAAGLAAWFARMAKQDGLRARIHHAALLRAARFDRASRTRPAPTLRSPGFP